MEPPALLSAALILAAYACGSIPTGVLLTRGLGIDLRRQGSGNIGATNVLRTAGTRLGILTLLGDAAKGALPTLGAHWIGAGPDIVAASGVAAVLGHCFPATARFAGGKGVATALGALLVLSPSAIACGIVGFGGVLWRWRMVSASSLAGATVAALATVVRQEPPSVIVAATTIAAVVWLRHRDNLLRLFAGTEPRIGARKKQAAA